MATSTRCDKPHLVRLASTPGGAARQYRVQYHERGTLDWHHYASYGQYQSAHDCLEQLLSEGYEARIVECTHCATGM